MSDPLTKLAYQAFQQGKSYFGLTHKALSAQAINLINPPSEKRDRSIDPAILQQIHQRIERLTETDWRDAEQGVYPTNLLFDNPWEDFFRYYPLVWFDLPAIWQRAKQKRYQDLPTTIDKSSYPSYYLQNFHHQTDGYLSDWSANLYDLQVELLFNGTADAMRRRVLAPLKRGLEAFTDMNPSQIRVLDVACGTGRTLRFLRGMLPQASLYGVDLSPAYLRKANQLLSQISGELPQLLQANGEALPFVDHYFHGLTCVFLFHELPAQARQQVMEECFRVLKPGGTFVICDSIQLSDSPELSALMEGFPTLFHEPYYRHYVQDDLIARLKQAGFDTVTEEVHFMSKYLIARKPVATGQTSEKTEESAIAV